MAAVATRKTNERPGTRAQHRYARMSAYKARQVLDLIRGLPVDRADEVLEFTERAAAAPIRKLLASAIANAEHNDQLDGETLYVAACYADEGPTLKRWRPRARGRATRIRKRTCHITIVVAAMPPEMLARIEAEETGGRGRRGRRGRAAEARRARVAKSRGEALDETTEDTEPEDVDEIEDTELDELEADLEAEDTDEDVEDETDEDAEAEVAEADTEDEDEASDTDDADKAEKKEDE
jgi:large subunit ribosomal protein L22